MEQLSFSHLYRAASESGHILLQVTVLVASTSKSYLLWLSPSAREQSVAVHTTPIKYLQITYSLYLFFSFFNTTSKLLVIVSWTFSLHHLSLFVIQLAFYFLHILDIRKYHFCVCFYLLIEDRLLFISSIKIDSPPTNHHPKASEPYNFSLYKKRAITESSVRESDSLLDVFFGVNWNEIEILSTLFCSAATYFSTIADSIDSTRFPYPFICCFWKR